MKFVVDPNATSTVFFMREKDLVSKPMEMTVDTLDKLIARSEELLAETTAARDKAFAHLIRLQVQRDMLFFATGDKDFFKKSA